MRKLFIVLDITVSEHSNTVVVSSQLRDALEVLGITVNDVLQLTPSQIDGLIHYTNLGVERSATEMQRAADKLEELRRVLSEVSALERGAR